MKNLNFLTKNLIAHRGLHDDKITENTLAAFEEAIKNNYIIEFDVHLLKDNNIVVYHDDNLKRLTGINKNIKDLDLEQIKKIDQVKIPTLEETLKLIDDKVPIIVELKYDNKVGKLEKQLVKYLDNYKGLFAVKSFNPLIVRWFKKHRPNYIRGLLLAKEKRKKNKLFYYLCKPDFLSCEYKLYNDKIMKIKIPKLCWTIKKREDYDKYKKYFDNLICEKILTKKQK